MPKVGKEEFDYTIEGMAEAEAYSEATGFPVSNAQNRNVQTYIHGGQVTGRGLPSLPIGSNTVTADNTSGKGPIGTSLYNKGGKVKKQKK